MPKIRVTTTDLSLFFGLPILAYSEWRFGVEVLGLPEAHLWGMTLSLALFVPGFLDTYVVAAMRRGGSEVGWALALVVTSVTGSAVAHLYELSAEQKVIASAVFGCMLAVVIWRVKHISHVDSSTAAIRAVSVENVSLREELRRGRCAAAEIAAARRRNQDVRAAMPDVHESYADAGPTQNVAGTPERPAPVSIKTTVCEPHTAGEDEVGRRRARRSRVIGGSRAQRDERARLVLSEQPAITGPELRRALLESGWSVSDRTGARILAGLRRKELTAEQSGAPELDGIAAIRKATT